MDKLILFLLIIVLILCFKNINVMVKKSDEDVMKVIIVLITIGLLFMCRGDLVEGILSDNQMKKECRGVERCGTETKDEKGNTIKYYCLNKNKNICSADKYDKCENSNDPMVWCINEGSMSEFIISLDKNNDNQFDEADFKVIDNDGDGNITDAEIGFDFLTQPVTLDSIKLLYDKYTSGNTDLDPDCEHHTCSVNSPPQPPTLCWTGPSGCGSQTEDECNATPGFHYCNKSGDPDGGDSGGGESGGGDSGGGDSGSSPYIQFLNKTGEDMYIYFDKDPKESGRVFNPPVIPMGNTTFMVKVSNNQTFNISSSSNIIGNWFGGECSITNKQSYASNDNMNHAGLTSFEWTIDNANKIVAANISNVSGSNVNGKMNISGLNCDKNTSVNNMELDTTSENGCYKDFGIMTGGAGDIPSCSIKKKEGINTAPKDGLICGDNNDCLGCPLIEGCDWGGNYAGECYASILKRKYGCLEWWTNNEVAVKWKNYNTANGSDAYWWGMGEQILGNNTYNNEIIYDGSPLNDTAVKCINGAIKDKNICQGYIITNPEGSLRTCKRDNPTIPFMIKFTINKIMKI